MSPRPYRLRTAAAGLAALVAAGSPAHADRDSDLAAAAAEVRTRSDVMIQTHVDRPFPALAPDPASPALGNAAYALSALWLDTDVARANQLLIDVRDGAFTDEYWAMGQLVRTYMLFHCDSAHRPGRLTPAAEEALKDILRRHLDLYSRAAEAADPTAWTIDGSENHDIMRRSVDLLGAAILAADPARAVVPLADGVLPADHHAAWSAYFVRYLQERGRKGLFVERGSPTYSKYTLQCLFNLRDFAASRDIRELAGKVLDLFFADASHEVLDGVRGGAKSRSYHDRSSALGTSDSVRAYVHLLAGSPATVPLTQHPSSLCAATSDYRMPRVVMDLVLHPEDKGTYSYQSRPPALGTREVIPPPIDTFLYHAEFPSDLLATTLATPAWIAGAGTVDPNATYMQIHSQNRWAGVIFSGSLDSRVYAHCVALQSGNRVAYDEMTSIAEGDALVVQRLARSTGGPLRVYFSSDLVREEEGGWVFAQDPAGTGWIGVRPARGAFTWDAPEATFPNGTWMRPDEPDIPVIMQLGLSGDFGGDFAAFKTRVQSNALQWPSATELHYTPSRGQEITWMTGGALPQLGGVTVDLAPPKVFFSPFFDWDFDSLTGAVTSTTGYGSRTLSLDLSLPPSTPQQIVLEAESAALTALMTLGEHVAASGRSFAHVPDGVGAGGSARFAFTTSVDASWTLWARVYWLDGGGNSVTESIDGEPQQVLGNGVAVPYWQWIRGATRVLAAGQHELIVANREDGSRLDQIVLTSSGDDSPPVTIARALSDTDGDGVPDAWLQSAFGHALGDASDLSRAADDADGDGETTLDEFLAGTNARDPADSLKIFLAKPAGSPAIRFATRTATGPQCPAPSRLYDVLLASAPSGPWLTASGLENLPAGLPVDAPLPVSGALAFYVVSPSLR